MKLSVCIPVYNEREIIADAVRTFTGALDIIAKDDYELIICNDGSVDEAADIARSMVADYPRLRVVGYPVNRGKGCAVRTAVMEAEGDIILYTDCDNAYGTDKIAEVLAVFDADPTVDAVIGSRKADPRGYEGYTPIRKLASKVYILVLKLFAGFKMSDSQCGFKAFRRAAAKEIFSRCETDGFAFDIEALLIADRLGYKIKEIPVRVINHRESKSKVNIISDTLRMLRDLRRIKKHVKRCCGK